MQQTLPGRTERRHRLHRDRLHQSGSSSTAVVRLTTPCSPPLLLQLLPSQSLPPSALQMDTTQLTPPPTSLLLKRPGRGPTVFLQRGRKWQRVACDVVATKLKPRSSHLTTAHPVRIRLSFRIGPLLLLHPVLCSPEGASGRWLHLTEKKRDT